ncbi:MAG: acetyl-CoA C-acyltransferase, partial [Flavobacteriales bacterium]|nr:acetyl-CoA C-acyltransferase [Flavobacteriales bacterium]
MKDVVIVSAVRTPMGSFMGSLSSVPATKLGAVAIKGAVERASIDPNSVQEVFMGNVLQAGVGQAPARQAAMGAGLSTEVPCTTINKVCASGMKSIMLGAQSIMTGMNDIVVAGGMENMSQTPHYVSMRNGHKYGNGKMVDGIINDGLMDVYTNQLMGTCAELCAKEHEFSREDQDNFAISSYKKSAKAWENGWFKDEIVPVEIPQRKGDPIIFAEDEEYKAVKFEKIPQLRAAFAKDGTITAANASTINDGASALVLMSAEKAAELGLTPLAKIRSFADAAQSSEWFTTSPSKAVPIAVKRAGLEIGDVDFWELNEPFS